MVFFYNDTYKIELDPEVTPVIDAPCRVPIELQDQLKAQLEEIEQKGIIVKVSRPTDWINSLVVQEKENGELQGCLGPEGVKHDPDKDSANSGISAPSNKQELHTLLG